MKRLFLFALTLMLGVEVVNAQDLLAPLEIGSVKARTWGFTQFNADNSEASEDQIKINALRALGEVTAGPWTFFGEFEPVNGRSTPGFNKNWLNQLWVKYEYGDWSFKAGRSFSSALKVTNPPFLQETVQYEGVGFGAYGTGLQVGWSRDGMYNEATVSARHNMQFDGSEQFDFLEYGVYSSIPIGQSGLKSSASAQASKNFIRVFGGYSFRYGSFHTRGGVYRGDEIGTENDRISGIVFMSYRLLSWLEAHYRVERASSNGVKDTIATTGVRLVSKNENITLTANYVGHSNIDIENLFLARFQLRF